MPSGALPGHVVTAETRAKISAKLKGRPLTAETRERMRGRKAERSPRWKGEDATREAKHMWLVKHYPKSGACDECGEQTATHYAFKHHPDPHTRDRDDYRELCDPCHKEYDRAYRYGFGRS
jgi:hypothetical protein